MSIAERTSGAIGCRVRRHRRGACKASQRGRRARTLSPGSSLGCRRPLATLHARRAAAGGCRGLCCRRDASGLSGPQHPATQPLAAFFRGRDRSLGLDCAKARWRRLRASAHARRSILRRSAFCSTPARVIDGAIANARRASSSRARKDWRSPASTCSRSGLFSSQPERPLQVDAAALKSIDAAKLAQGFQADANNPLIGLDQRAALLRRLGHALEARPDLFGATGRPGYLADYLGAALSRRKYSGTRWC